MRLTLLQFVALSALTLSLGCRAARMDQSCQTRPDIGSPVHQYASGSPAPGVSKSFEHLQNGIDAVVVDSNEGLNPPQVILLQDALCNAASNSPTANSLVTHLKKLKSTQLPVECPGALDLALKSQIIEERNKTASLAGQVFLGLVEIELQRGLLVEAREKLDSVTETIADAEEEGFATAEPKALIAKQFSELSKRESELKFNHDKLSGQLKALVGLDSSATLELSYDLRPMPMTIDLANKKATASGTRAELVALQRTLATWDKCSASAARSILSSADPRMGFELAKAVISKKCLWPIFKTKDQTEDPCEEKALYQQMIAFQRDSEKLIHLAVENAAFEVEHEFSLLTIADQDVMRLQGEVVKISARKDDDASAAYVDLQKNWYETLLARSKRISKGIAYESAQIRLAEATGELGLVCGHGLELEATMVEVPCVDGPIVH